MGTSAHLVAAMCCTPNEMALLPGGVRNAEVASSSLASSTKILQEFSDFSGRRGIASDGGDPVCVVYASEA